MGRSYKQAVLAPEFVQDGDSQPHSLSRIGAGAQFIQEHQSFFCRMLQNLNDPCQVGGKGGQVLRYALPIPDIA
ncbi:hypothetical protein D3C75_1308940 [compost metagenome]